MNSPVNNLLSVGERRRDLFLQWSRLAVGLMFVPIMLILAFEVALLLKVTIQNSDKADALIQVEQEIKYNQQVVLQDTNINGGLCWKTDPVRAGHLPYNAQHPALK